MESGGKPSGSHHKYLKYALQEEPNYGIRKYQRSGKLTDLKRDRLLTQLLPVAAYCSHRILVLLGKKSNDV